MFVANEAEIREPGDYITIDIGPTSVILVRDDDGSVGAFRNVCRHRGARLLSQPRGSVGNLVCGYHHWTYGTDGSLRYAESQPPDFDRSCFGLRRVALRSVEGLLMICLADDPPTDIDDFAATVEPYLAVHALREAKVATQDTIVDHGNWKLVMENNRECYHCGGHPELTASMFSLFAYADDDVPARLRPEFERQRTAADELSEVCARAGIPTQLVEHTTGRPTGFLIQRSPLDQYGESFSADGRRLSQRLLGRAPDWKLGYLQLHVQPNAWFHFLGDHAVTFTVLPVTPDRSLLRTTWLIHPDAAEGADYDLDSLTRTWRATNDQDRAFIEAAHRGVSDPGYLPGPYAPVESQVEAFVAWYCERLAVYDAESVGR